MKIGDVCEFKVNFKDADFWLIRKGSEKTVGTPTKDFSPEHIGVRVNREFIDPQFMYYKFMALHMSGFFSKLSSGTTNLKHISISTIKDFPITFT
jgi:hypothetical protein